MMTLPPNAVELYGTAQPVIAGKHAPVNRWLARLHADPWPHGLRQCPLPAPLDHPFAALLPIYAPDTNLVGVWAMAVTPDGEAVQQFALGNFPDGSTVRLEATPAQYMAVMASVPQALTAYARFGGPIWCPEWPTRLPHVELPPTVAAVSIAWADDSAESRADAQALKDRLAPAMHAFAGDAGMVECMLPGRPEREGRRRQLTGPPVPVADEGPADAQPRDWTRDQGLLG